MHSVLPALQLLLCVSGTEIKHAHLFIFYGDNRERDKDRKVSYSDACMLLTFSGVSNFDGREFVFIFAYDTKKKEHQNTRQSDLYSGATHLVQIR
jgi:hypothetical protein